MTQSACTRILFVEPQRSVAFGAIGANYVAIGTPIDLPARMIYFLNATDALLQFSYDGVNDHFALPANSFKILDITTNQLDRYGFYLPKGTQIYVKQIGVPTSGAVYLTIYAGKER